MYSSSFVKAFLTFVAVVIGLLISVNGDIISPVETACNALTEPHTFTKGSCFWKDAPASYTDRLAGAALSQCNAVSPEREGRLAFIQDQATLAAVASGLALTPTDELLVGLVEQDTSDGNHSFGWGWTDGRDAFGSPSTVTVPRDSLLWIDAEPDGADTATVGLIKGDATGLLDGEPGTSQSAICEFVDRNAPISFAESISHRNRRLSAGSNMIIDVVTDLSTFVFCQQRCIDAKVCGSFSYGENEQECELHYHMPHGTGPLQVLAGWRWFHKM